MKLSKVAITGMGVCSALGQNVEENFNHLITKQSGLRKVSNINTIHTSWLNVGEIKTSTKSLMQQLNLPKENAYTRTSMLAILAVIEAMQQSNINNVNEIETALISSSSVGGMDMTEKYYQDFFNSKEAQRYIPSHDIGNTTQKVADYIGLKGMVTSLSTACSSSANAILIGARLIQTGVVKRAIVGGADALTKFTINGFNTLMILTDELNTPFDENRKGLNLGEGAAFLILESDESLRKTHNKVLAYIDGYGNTNDAFHQTASSANGEGAYLAMKKAFDNSSIFPHNIDYINAHGTATPNNDITEAIALTRLYNKTELPPFSSTKPYTGHTLAAAAAIEAVYSVLAIQHNTMFPNLHFKTPISDCPVVPLTTLKQDTEVRHVLSNSFGFGGNCSSLIFSAS